jgi:hypothetical protein
VVAASDDSDCCDGVCSTLEANAAGVSSAVPFALSTGSWYEAHAVDSVAVQSSVVAAERQWVNRL